MNFMINGSQVSDYFHIVDDACLGNFDVYLGSKIFIETKCILDHSELVMSSVLFSCPIQVEEKFFGCSILEDISVAVATGGLSNAVDHNYQSLMNYIMENSDKINRFKLGHIPKICVASVINILDKFPSVFEDLRSDNMPVLTFDSLDLTTDKYIQAAIYRSPRVHDKLIKEEMEN